MNQMDWERLRELPKPERNAEIVELVKGGTSSAVIAEHLGMSRQRVYQLVERTSGVKVGTIHGGQRGRPPVIPRDAIEGVVARLRNWETPNDIAREYGCHPCTVVKLANENGIILRDMKRQHREETWIPKAQALLDQHVSIDRCAVMVGVNRGSVWNAVKHGVLTVHRRKHEQKYPYDIDDVLARLDAGERMVNIAASFSMPYSTLDMRVRYERRKRSGTDSPNAVSS